jgi:hypothetical protein
MKTIDVFSLTATQQWALRECAQFKQGYRFKPKTMAKLADLGLARASDRGYVLTWAGEHALTQLRAARRAKIEADQRAYARHA